MEWKSRQSQNLKDLETLNWDHKFLSAAGDHRIAICVDVFDLLELAFPYVRRYGPRSTDFFDHIVQYDLLKGQIDRTCLAFGFPKGQQYYPILIPPPYAREFFSFIRSPSVITDSMNIQKQMGNFVRASVERFSISPHDLLAKLESNEDIQKHQLLDLFIDICPDLLFVVSGMLPQGLNMIRTTFESNLVTMDIAEWGIPGLNRLITDEGIWLDDFNFSDHKENARLQFMVTDIMGYFVPSWLADIQSLRLVKHLNERLNPKIIVIFVSSAPMINRLFQNDEIQKEFSSKYTREDGKLVQMPFLRGIGEFGYYVRLVQDIKDWSHGVEASVVVEKVALETAKLHTESQKSRIDRGFFSSNLLRIINEFLEPYAKGPHGIGYISESMFAVEGLSKYAKVVVEAMLSFETLQSYYTRSTIQKRVILANEAIGWLALSKLQGVLKLKEVVKSYAVDFSLFPFRVKFETSSVIKQVKVITGLFKILAEPFDDRKTREFHEALSELALRSSSSAGAVDNFWGRELQILDHNDKDSLERRLVWLVLLMALRHYKQVYQEVDELLTDGVLPLLNEFRIIAIQARIRELVVRTISYKIRRHSVMEIIETCEKWAQSEGRIDVRIRHLEAFALGTLARMTDNDMRLEAGKGFNRKWAIEICNSVLDELGAREFAKQDKLDSIDWETRHLIGTVASNLAYYLAAGGEENELQTAAKTIDDYGLEDKFLTSICLHNKGYVFLRLLEYQNELKRIEYFYSQARQCFIKSNHRRAKPLQIEPIFRMSDEELLEKIKATAKTLFKDCICLEKTYREKVGEKLRSTSHKPDLTKE